ncbi:MAG: molybdopterin-dependent oxidoreductase [Gordonibacter sp.]|nr:molybdopterin-dependent oxidoreductase [Gordonibacter sp.]
MDDSKGTVLGAPVNRRSFIKGSAAAVLAAGIGTSLAPATLAIADEKNGSTPKETITPGVCRGGCGHGCQMNVHVRDGKIVKTSRINKSEPDTTRLCNKGLTHALRVYAEDRLKYPMKRVGERGSGEWEQISWDEAFTTITDKWKEVAEKYGPGANAFTKSAGNISPDANHGLRLQSAMGATLIDSSQDRVFYAAFPAFFGNAKGAGGCGREDVYNSKNIFIWGANLAEAYSQTFHITLRAKAEHGAKIIVIDPCYNTTSAKADLFVPIRPGTDAALALAMAHVLESEGLVKEDFLIKNTVAPFLVKESDGTYLRLSDLGKATAGTDADKILVCGEDGRIGTAEEISNPVLRGSFTIEGIAVNPSYELLLERVHEWTPEKASKLCDVPVDTIIELAHLLADGPTAVSVGLGLDHLTNGWPTFASIISATMMAGQFGQPGNSGHGYWRGEFAAGWMSGSLRKVKDAPPFNTFYASALVNCFDKGKYGNTDINIKTLFCYSCNLLGAAIGTLKWREILDSLELFVVADVVRTSTTDYADIVLPACHYFECETASGDDTRYINYNAKAAEPLYESKSDFEIFRTLMDKMGLERYNFADTNELFNTLFDNPTCQKLGITWEKLKKEGSILTVQKDNRVFGQEGKFDTPTGRLQFYQEKLPIDGGNWGQNVDFMKERLPYWEEPLEAWSANPLAEKYPLTFTSERSKFKVHSQYTHVPWLLEFESEPYVTANPATCAERGIADGDYVRIFNDRSAFVCRVRFSDGTRPGMITIDHGWEADQFVEGYYLDVIPANLSPVIANSYYFDTLIDIEKATI